MIAKCSAPTGHASRSRAVARGLILARSPPTVVVTPSREKSAPCSTAAATVSYTPPAMASGVARTTNSALTAPASRSISVRDKRRVTTATGHITPAVRWRSPVVSTAPVLTVALPKNTVAAASVVRSGRRAAVGRVASARTDAAAMFAQGLAPVRAAATSGAVAMPTPSAASAPMATTVARQTRAATRPTCRSARASAIEIGFPKSVDCEKGVLS